MATDKNDKNDIDRRKTPRRRLRDRIASLDRTANPSLRARPEVQNVLLLVEDELRESALALGAVEQFLGSTMELLESRTLSRSDLEDAADDEDTLERVETLADSLTNLRRHLRTIAASLK